MINAKEAAAIAKDYMQEMFGNAIEGVRLEEIAYLDNGNVWQVTMGFWEFPPQPPSSSLVNALALYERGKAQRAYKQIEIDAGLGEVRSMKIRTIPTPPSISLK